MSKKLFDTYQLGELALSSRVVMAPLTRCRAVNNNVPNEIMATYYGQRAGAGLIIAEGTSPSPDGLGYTNIPGIFNQEHTDAWKLATTAVHERGGKIFLQFMHTGRIGHSDNLPAEGRVIGPSPIPFPGEISTYNNGKQPYPIPVEMNLDKVNDSIAEFVTAARLSMQANFDGVEIHAAHGYLPNQFINETSNSRTDQYGGSIENRCRFVLEIVEKTIAAIGAEKVGIRISPFSYVDGEENPNQLIETYTYLAEKLDKLGVVYVHLSHMGETLPLKFELWHTIRKLYTGTVIIAGDFTLESAEEALHENRADLIAFGRDYIANPDLVERFKNKWPLAERNREEWYGNTASGYSDYPFYEAK